LKRGDRKEQTLPKGKISDWLLPPSLFATNLYRGEMKNPSQPSLAPLITPLFEEGGHRGEMKSLPNLPLRREGAEETDQIISPQPSFTKGGSKVKKNGREMRSGRSRGKRSDNFSPAFFLLQPTALSPQPSAYQRMNPSLNSGKGTEK